MSKDTKETVDLYVGDVLESLSVSALRILIDLAECEISKRLEGFEQAPKTQPTVLKGV